jgi:hypothetical protein
MERVVVEPLGNGWAVRSDALDNLMVFRSGGAAERAGLFLTRGLAAAGEPAELQVRLKDGTRAARFVCLPPTDRDPDPLMVGVRPTPPTSRGAVGPEPAPV